MTNQELKIQMITKIGKTQLHIVQKSKQTLATQMLERVHKKY